MKSSYKVMRDTSEEVEIKCDACGGSGTPPVAHSAQVGRKVYPPPCKKCGGKGRLRKPAPGAGVGAGRS